MAMRGDGAAFFEAVDIRRRFQLFRQSTEAQWVDRNHPLAVVWKLNLFTRTIEINRTQKVPQFDAREYLCDLLLPFNLFRLSIFHRPADLFHFSQPVFGYPVNVFAEQVLL